LGAQFFTFQLPNFLRSFCHVTAETFKQEIADAIRAYDKYIVCLDKSPEDCEASLKSLVEKAIKAYENRGPHLRHGIALDRQVTIILSQTDSERPLCGIYFNLHSPYQKKSLAKAAKQSG
jgi:hypothetical protein